MRLKTVGVVYRKELLEALRDWRTLIATIFIPLIIFPLLTVGFSGLAAKSMRKVQKEGSTVMILGATNAPELAAIITKTDGIKTVESTTNFMDRISNRQLRAAIEFPVGFEQSLKNGSTTNLNVKIYHYLGEIRSGFAVRALESVLNDYRERIVGQRLKERGLNRDFIKPFATVNENVAAPEKVSGNLIGGLIPYFIILLCFVGAVQPAIDITAGEKERGTIETLLATPVERLELVAGKFLMIMTASLTTTLIALFSLGGTFALPFLALKELSRAAGSKAFALDLSVAGLASVFLLVLPLAVLFSAGLLALGLLAKSHKEAQTYITPLILLILLPPIYAMLPGAELNYKLVFVPILNVCLVSKELLSGNFPWPMVLITFTTSCAYAFAALLIAVNTFKRESVLFRA